MLFAVSYRGGWHPDEIMSVLAMEILGFLKSDYLKVSLLVCR